MRVLGIDPGLNITGYGVVEIRADLPGALPRQPRLIEAGVVRGAKKGTLSSRVHEIHAGIVDVIASLSPDAVAIEELYSHYQRPRTAILMGHARGVICLAAAAAGLEVAPYAATQVKKTLTGNGRAPKSQVQLAIRRELQLAQLPEPADVADALAIALCHAFALASSRHILPAT